MSNQADAPTKEFDRVAVVTIQGGGAFGLSLLGQLAALVYDCKFTPLAVAGTSAGAIVATLYWAGYTPREIRNLFIEIASEGQLPEVLGPFEPTRRPFTFASFRALKSRLEGYFTWFGGQFQPRRQFFLWTWASAGPRLAKALWIAKRVQADVAPHLPELGVFRGEKLEQQLDAWLRAAPRIAPYADELPSGRLLEFGDIAALSRTHPEIYLPPLFLTTTNLATRQLELIDSFDSRYQSVPIGRAVRASAGVPIFFRPVQIPGCPQAGYYVDGGVVSNFPAWVFADEIRRRLATSEPHYGLVPRPWVHVGLRLSADASPPSDTQPTPIHFLFSLAGLLAGHARNQLEDLLAAQVARSIIVRQSQSETGGPKDMLALQDINEARIRAMYDRGRECAEAEVSTFSFALPDSEWIQPILDGLLQQACCMLGERNNNRLHLRSNVFLPCGRWLRLRYAANMAEDWDRDLKFDFRSGLTGWCFTYRQPLICNMARIRGLFNPASSESEPLFGMSADEHLTVREDRTWLASVPIFDPLAMYPRDLAAESGAGHPNLAGRHYHRLRSASDGAVLGVLNLDAALPYEDLGLDEDPENQMTDPRVRGIIALMQATSFDLGKVLSDHFAQRGDQ